jgi:hypothetical protein
MRVLTWSFSVSSANTPSAAVLRRHENSFFEGLVASRLRRGGRRLRREHFVSLGPSACVFLNRGAMKKNARWTEIAAEIERLLAELRPLRATLSSGDFTRLDEQKRLEARLEALIEEREKLERGA